MIKKILIIWSFLALQRLTSIWPLDSSVKKDSIIPDVAAYMGQTPPGDTPVVFAPGVISLPNRNVPSITVSPDGKLIFFYVAFWPKPGDPYVMYTKYSSGKWTIPETASFSKNRKSGEPFFADDGDRLYMFATDAVNKVSFVDLSYVEKKDSTWSNPVSLGNPPNYSTDQYHPCIVAGRSIYFANSSGEICRSQFSNGAYQVPDVLPFPINHANATQTWGDPFVSVSEDYLIFKSTRIGGYGGNDIYISYKKSDGSWTNPKNLGDKINTSGDETSGDITPDGKYMTFGREGTMYWVAAGFIERLRHTNFAPYLKKAPANLSAAVGQPFYQALPADMLIDDDGNNTLTWSAALDNGAPLPAWLRFEPSTRTFSGTPTEKGTIKTKIAVTDTSGAAASTTFSIDIL